MSKLVKVRRADPPGGPGNPRYAGATLLDSFAVVLPTAAPTSPRDLATLALTDPPAAFRAALWLRDAIMTRLGVKSSARIRSEPDGRERIDFFPVLSVTEDEIEVGENDRHLDFRTWMSVTMIDGQRTLQSTTAAFAHNRLGRLYLAVIRPAHVAVVKSSLRRAVGRVA